MPDFSISDISHEPDKPQGDSLWLFRKIGSDETQFVPADTPNEAWRGIRYFKDDEWLTWALIGHDEHVGEDDDPMEVAVNFAARDSVTNHWDENDEEE